MKTLKKWEIQHINIFVTHFSSIKLTKIYVQLTLKQLRVNLQESEKAIFNWNTFVSFIAKTINIKLIQIYKYTSVKLLFNFHAQYLWTDKQFKNELQEIAVTNNTEY